jgi:tRNA(Ile)-lysidine synthase TilS/MesJ
MIENYLDYDLYVIAFSGGKDSLACLLHLLELGIPKSKIELWHHRIDGTESDLLFDWVCTDDYIKKIGEAMQIPAYFSWREGGLEKKC